MLLIVLYLGTRYDVYVFNTLDFSGGVKTCLAISL